MTRYLSILFSLIFSSWGFAQSIMINPPEKEESQMDFPSLTRSVLSSECVTIGAVSTAAGNEQIAYFEGGDSDFPFSRGIMLTTGNALAQIGPNTSFDQTTSDPNLGGYFVIQEILDARLGNLSTVRNSVSTRFDFIPQTSQISFRYIFASEAYADPRNISCDNGDNLFQDGFAIILKGPGVIPDLYDHDGNPLTPEIEFAHGGKNIALLDDGSTEAGMHSIHNNTNCNNFGNALLYEEIPLGTGSIESNGNTVPLSATSDVTIGEQYSLEIIITNRGDTTLDSSLFIEGSEELVEPNIKDNYIICQDIQGQIIEPFQMVDTGIINAGYRFRWFFEGMPLENEDGRSLSLEASGQYIVEVIGLSGCSSEYNFFVSSSSPPTNISYGLAGPVFTDEQQLVITAEGNGNYLYQLNESEQQSSPIFESISPGTYRITVSDINGCGSDTVDVEIIDYPKFFTPNNDGVNDFWNINFSDINRSGKISIFDRYGQLIATTSSNINGWDGTFNGNRMPSSDYWFVAEFDDGFVFKNHFTLKR